MTTTADESHEGSPTTASNCHKALPTRKNKIGSHSSTSPLTSSFSVDADSPSESKSAMSGSSNKEMSSSGKNAKAGSSYCSSSGGSKSKKGNGIGKKGPQNKSSNCKASSTAPSAVVESRESKPREVDAMSKSNEDHEQRVSAPNSPPVSAPAKAKTVISPEEPSGDDNVIDGKIGSEKRSNTPQEEVLQPAFVMNQDVETIDILEAANAPLASAHPARHHHHSSRHPSGRPSRQDEHEYSRHYNQHSQSHSHRHSSSYRSHHSRARSPSPISHSPYSRSHHHRKHLSTSGIITSRRGRSRSPVSFTNNSRPGSRNGSTGGSASRNSSAGRPTSRNDSHSGSCVDGSSRPGSRCSAAATPTMANGNSNHPHHHRGHHHYRQERHPQVSSAAHAAATAAVAAVADHQSHRHHQSRYSPSHTMMNGEYSHSPPYDAENPHNGASADNNKWPSLGDSFDLPPLRSMSYGLLGEGSFDWNGANEQGDNAGATGGRSPSPPPDGRYYEHRRHPHYQDRRERDRNHDRERERERDRHYRSRSGSPHHHRSHSYSSRPSSSNSNYHHHQHHNRDHYSPSRARSPSPSDHHRHSTRGRRDSYQPLYSEHHILSSSSRDYTRDGFSSPSSYKQGGNVNSNSKSSRSRRSRSSSARPPSSVFRGVAPSANTPSTAPVVRGRYGESWSFQDEDSPKSCNQHHQYDHSSDASHYSRDRRSRVDGFGGATSAFVEDSKLKGTIKHHSAHRSGNSKPSPEGSSRDLPEQLLLKLDSRSFQGEEGCEDNKKISFQAHSKEPSSPNAAAAEAANIDKELNATDGFENLMGITDGDYLANLSFRKSYDLEQVFSFMRPSFDQGDTGEVDGEENKIAPDGSNTHGSTRSHSRALSSFNLSAMSFSNSFGGGVPAGGDPVAEEPREAPPRDETSVRGDAGVILEQEQRNVAHDSKEDYGVDNNETIRKQHRRYTSSPSHHYRRGSPIGGIPTLHTLPSQGSSLGLTPINSFNCELVSGAGSGSGIIPLTSNDGMALREFFSSSPVGARTSPLPPVGMPPPAPATPRHDNLGYSHPKPSRSEAEVQRRRSPPPPSPRQPTHTPPSYTTNKYHRPHSRPPTYQHGPSVIDGGSTAGSLAVASTHESHPRSQAAVMPPNKRMKILRQHETKPLIDLSKRSDFFALLKKLAPALGGFQFKLPEIDFPQTASYNSYKPTEAQLTIARRRISSCICAFGGCVPSRTVSFDSIAPGTGSTLLNEKEEMEEKKKYEDQLSSRYFMKEQSISWDVELHEVITPKSASRKEATTELNKKEGHDSLYCVPITPNNNNPASSSDSNSRKEGQKTKYRCKLCGQPKQNHTCPYQSSLVRSIGTMVYPVVNAFETEEPGNLAPALSEMNNFTSLLSQDVSTSYGRERDPPYRPYTGGYSNVLTPDSHWSPNTPGGLSTMSDPSTPASTHGRPPQSSFRKREHLLLSRDETMSAASTSGGLLRGAMDLKREQYRNVRVFTDIIPGAYEYPHIPTPYAQRKEMGDTLFSLSREVPKLADSCAAILREARENDKWDQAVSELTTQVLIILKCEENDHTLEGLKRHLLTLGIAC